MALRRQRKWGEELTAPLATVIAPGAHDLLAADAGTRHGSTHGAHRPSVSLQVTHSDLAVDGVAEVVMAVKQGREGRL